MNVVWDPRSEMSVHTGELHSGLLCVLSKEDSSFVEPVAQQASRPLTLGSGQHKTTEGKFCAAYFEHQW